MAKTLRTSGDYTIKAGDGFNSGSGTNTISLDSLNVSVTGNLTVGGTSTTVNTTNTTIEDNIIELNTGATANTNSAGIIIERGSTGDNAAIIFKEDTDTFVLGTTTATAADKSSSISITAGAVEVGAFTASSLTVTGASSLDGVQITDNTIKSSASNADLELDGSGSGVVKLLDNAEVVGTLTTANITNTNNITTTQLDADGVRLKDNTITTSASNADLEINASGSGTVVLENLKVGSGATVTTILDEDNMSSDSATALATQQSIKAYVDAEVTAQDLDFATDDSTALSIDLDSETLQFSGGPNITTSGSGNTVTISLDTALSNLTSVQVDGITLADNKISANASNSALQLASSGTGDVEIDAGGDLIVDVDNADVILKDDGTEFGRLSRVTADFVVKASAQDQDLLFKGNDGGSTVTALTLDMSEGGDAVFGGKLVTNGNRITHAQAGTVSFMDFTVTQFGQDNNTVLSSVKSINMFLDSNGGDTGQAFRIYNNTNPDSSPTENTYIFKVQEDGALFVTGDTSITGNVTATDVTANSLTTNVISSNGSNANISIQASGTGSVEIGALDIKGTSISSADSTLVNINESVNVTGTLTSRGNVFGVQRLTGSGSTEVVNLTDTVTLLITTGSSQQFSLADGVEGQIKIISMVTDGGTGVVTPANFVNGTNITFDDVEDTVTLLYQSTGWVALARQNAVFG